jgi:hypothetical protein
MLLALLIKGEAIYGASSQFPNSSSCQNLTTAPIWEAHFTSVTCDSQEEKLILLAWLFESEAAASHILA